MEGSQKEKPELPQDLIEALDGFAIASHKIIEGFRTGILAKPLPPLIYHYTDDVGLKGILETGQLWMTDIFNLNDPSELHHGISHAVKILKEFADDGPTECKRFAQMFASFYPNGVGKVFDGYVCAFSSDGDELGQWRAYADNGRGYALGFDAKALEDVILDMGDKPIDCEYMAFPVYYDDNELAKVHRALIEAMYPLISLPFQKQLDKLALNDYMRRLVVQLTVQVVTTALFFKHEAYKNEAEYRFLQGSPPSHAPLPVKRRYRPYELVKYRELNWRRPAIVALKKIVVGPAADRLKAIRFAEECLSAFHSGDVEIFCSGIPYRAV